jgi:hypothetical protein
MLGVVVVGWRADAAFAYNEIKPPRLLFLQQSRNVAHVWRGLVWWEQHALWANKPTIAANTTLPTASLLPKCAVCNVTFCKKCGQGSSSACDTCAPGFDLQADKTCKAPGGWDEGTPLCKDCLTENGKGAGCPRYSEITSSRRANAGRKRR